MAASWRKLAAAVRGHADRPAHTDLETARWDGRREDFGKPRPGDYPGGPRITALAWRRTDPPDDTIAPAPTRR